jgi:hypothetical protein
MVSSRYQLGYLYEIPLAVFALLLALALTVPHLPVFWRKIVLGVAIVPILFCLFCVIVRPGRTVGAAPQGQAYGRLALFLACAVAASVMVAGFVLR